MHVPFTMSDRSVTVFLDGRPHTVDATAPIFGDLKEALRDGAAQDTIRSLLSLKRMVENKTFGRVVVDGDAVFFDGRKMHGHLVDRMLTMLRDGFDVAPLARFMDRLMNNPSKTAVDELYLWLERSSMPITEDGMFLAYKKVRDDCRDFFSGTMDNSVGQIVQMPRNEVDDRRHNTCSYGLHFCSYSYLPSYHGDKGRVVVVKIDPADVVSIPSDYDNAKGRCWRYAVVGELDQNAAALAFAGVSVVSSYGIYDDSGSDVSDVDEDDWDVIGGDDEDEGWPDDDDDDEGIEFVGTVEVVESDEPEDEDAAETKGMIFRHRPTGFRATSGELENLLLKHGQRGLSKMTGVPRTTLQEWVKRLP